MIEINGFIEQRANRLDERQPLLFLGGGRDGEAEHVGFQQQRIDIVQPAHVIDDGHREIGVARGRRQVARLAPADEAHRCVVLDFLALLEKVRCQTRFGLVRGGFQIIVGEDVEDQFHRRRLSVLAGDWRFLRLPGRRRRDDHDTDKQNGKSDNAHGDGNARFH